MRIVFILVITCLTNFTVYSQAINLNENAYWLDFGAGIANSEQLAGNLSVNFTENNSIYKLRFLGVTELNFFGQNKGNINLGALYGKKLSNKHVQVSFLAGVGVTLIDEIGDKVVGSVGSGFFSYTKYNIERNHVFSIPLEIEFFFKPVKLLGLGVSLFGDINSKKSSYGILFKCGIGKFRK